MMLEVLEEYEHDDHDEEHEIENELKSKKTFRLISIDIEGLLNIDCGSVFTSSKKGDIDKDNFLSSSEKELIYDTDSN